jgi:hypothetical protein
VLADLDDTIRELLVRYVPLDLAEIEVSFDTPDREWSGRLTRPAVNCFLYDVRENTKLRALGWDVRRDNANNTASRQRVPTRIDATYQVTTWARAREDEHRLLWRALTALARFSTLPTDLLKGDLTSQPLPIPTSVAQPEQMPANFADIWQALENRIRPALTYVVTLVIETEAGIARPLVLRAPKVGVKNLEPSDVIADLLVRGRVRDRQDAERNIAGALVLLQETGDRVLTDEGGRFTFSGAPRGPITLIVRADGCPEVSQTLTVPTAPVEVEI